MNSPQDLLSRFGFHTTPFTRELRLDERFQFDAQEQSLEFLLRAVEQRMCAVLIAPPGTGKTVLLRALRARLPETRYRVHYIKVTDLSKRDFCREIACAVGAESAGNYPALVRCLQERFSATYDCDGLRPVLLIDEGHDIRPQVLGLLRLITNFDMDSRLVLSVVLAGQSALAKLLRHPTLEDVAHRLAHYANLRLLSRTETHQYVQHRCSIAGVNTVPFDRPALEALYEIGRGNLRATDHLALKALELAHEAGAATIDAQLVTQARGLLWSA